MKKFGTWILLSAILISCFVFDGHTQVVQAATNKESKEWVKVYEKKIKKLNRENESYKYLLIYVNKDDIPELVVDNKKSSEMSMYTYGNGKMHLLMDHWLYGYGGAIEYEYLPKKNVIYFGSSSHGGLEQYDTYMMIKKNKLVEKYSLSSEYDGKKTNYYYEDKKISEKKYESYQIKGKYKAIHGKYSYKQIMKKLKAAE